MGVPISITTSKTKPNPNPSIVYFHSSSSKQIPPQNLPTNFPKTMKFPMRRLPSTVLTSLSHPTFTALLRPLSTKPNDEWNDAWESAWLPDDLSGRTRAPWESDVNFSPSHAPPAADVADAETKAFVEDMTENWEERRRRSARTQKRQEERRKRRS